jgi:hypothetical protein
MWSVDYLPGADAEFAKLSAREQVAVTNAVKKLQALGPMLPFPHSGDARGVRGVRELRPRGGNSPTRPLYRRIRDRFFIGAIGPDGESDPRGFSAACRRAAVRLREKERELGNEQE